MSTQKNEEEQRKQQQIHLNKFKKLEQIKQEQKLKQERLKSDIAQTERRKQSALDLERNKAQRRKETDFSKAEQLKKKEQAQQQANRSERIKQDQHKQDSLSVKSETEKQARKQDTLNKNALRSNQPAPKAESTIATAKQLGAQAQAAGVYKAPPPVITKDDIKNNEKDFYQVGQKQTSNVVVREKNGYNTVYVNGNYTDYRKAYEAVNGKVPAGYDVDHVTPRSKLEAGQYTALSAIKSPTNRAHGNRGQENDYAAKVKGYDPGNEKQTRSVGTPTRSEIGRTVQHGVLIPSNRVDRNALKPLQKTNSNTHENRVDPSAAERAIKAKEHEEKVRRESQIRQEREKALDTPDIQKSRQRTV